MEKDKFKDFRDKPPWGEIMQYDKDYYYCLVPLIPFLFTYAEIHFNQPIKTGFDYKQQQFKKSAFYSNDPAYLSVILKFVNKFTFQIGIFTFTSVIMKLMHCEKSKSKLSSRERLHQG